MESYALTTRVRDAIAILDVLGIERTYYLGFSWGARLGFAIGEHAPERALSLVLCGNQPYEWPTESPMMRAVTAAVATGTERGMDALVESWGRRPKGSLTGRSWMLDNDPLGSGSGVPSAFQEGAISPGSLDLDNSMLDLRR